ncbi:hypothetical protein BDP27DRAFT_1428839 [Rhodocollybia butyracea]|uniref:Uncharacterized protein n=1 Tax=Rhodocollybia butyracea TaxID=206335 RepID=A0A9P5PDX9_9AGAR|nr:hypothetical protein BDP27DRAFT_1428839 [Rhodocollybia butyracea]
MISSDQDIYAPCSRPTKSWTKSADSNPACLTGKDLPEEYCLNVRRWRLDPEYNKPQNLFYGFGVDIQDFLDYHQRHQLPRPPRTKRQDFLWLSIMDAVTADLSVHCNFKIRRMLPLCDDYDYMIIFYDSHHISIQELEDDEEEDVIRVIKERFGDSVAQQSPRWFFPLTMDQR